MHIIKALKVFLGMVHVYHCILGHRLLVDGYPVSSRRGLRDNSLRSYQPPRTSVLRPAAFRFSDSLLTLTFLLLTPKTLSPLYLNH
jgi:hypothetical protein